MVNPITPKKFISGDLKPFEEQIVNFYQKIGDSVELNSTMTKIYAYLQLYQGLTQKELKTLTNLSSSTISTTLNAFIHSGIVKRELSSYTRSSLYKINSEDLTFQYIKFPDIMIILERLDNKIQSFQNQIRNYQDTYPKLTRFLHLRLNSYRNYFEAQRRAINDKQKYEFFEENVSNLEIGHDIIQFPPQLEAIIHDFINYLISEAFPGDNDPTFNLIFAHLGIRRCVTQELLIKNTNLSQSTISRYLNQAVQLHKAIALPKEYNTSRIYTLPSLSMYFLDLILATDDYIIEWRPKFQILLAELKKSAYSQENRPIVELLEFKLNQLVEKIPEIQIGRNKIASSKSELIDIAESYQL